MYPKVYEDFCRHRKEYGYITRMGSHVFFNGMALGETNKINIEDGKTLVIKYLGLGDHNDDGTVNVQFELNGMRREVAVRDPNASEQTRQVVQADESDPRQVGASIPGMVSKIHVQPGDTVEENQVLHDHRGYEDGDGRYRPHRRQGPGDPGEGGAGRQGQGAVDAAGLIPSPCKSYA